MRFQTSFFGAGALLISASFAFAADNPVVAEYRKVISPMLETHCYECHGDGYDKGKVAFDALETDEQILVGGRLPGMLHVYPVGIAG